MAIDDADVPVKLLLQNCKLLKQKKQLSM